MKKKHLGPKLMLGKKTITPLTGTDSDRLLGGDTGPSLYPTEVPSCRINCKATVFNCPPPTIGAAQTNCCPTWQPLCDSYIVSCLG